MDEFTRERYPGTTAADLERERRARPLRRHVFAAGRWRDHRGRRICECGSIEDASVHRVPERTDEERDTEARRIGDKS